MTIALAAAWLSLAVPPQAGFPLSLGGCALAEAKLGEVRSVFWDLYQHTEVCVSFPPDAAAGWLQLTFSFTHEGRRMKEPPRAIVLRAQLPPTAVVIAPSLSVVIDDKETLDLTAPGREYQVAYPPQCSPGYDSGCGFTGVEAALPVSLFRRIAAARSLRVTAFGGTTTLTPAARASLRALADRLPPPTPAR